MMFLSNVTCLHDSAEQVRRQQSKGEGEESVGNRRCHLEKGEIKLAVVLALLFLPFNVFHSITV